MKDPIERQAAIDAVLGACKDAAATECAIRELEELPPAQPDLSQCWGCNCPKMNEQTTLYGYNIEHLELIARVLQRENLPPERIAEVLTDIGRIVEIITNEFEETLRKAVQQCTI